MDFSTNRRLAVIILIIVICVFTLVGVNRSLSALASDISKGFYDGVYNDSEGYLEKSIQSHLNNRIDAANGMITMDVPAASDELDALRQARYALMNGETVKDKYEANVLLTECSERAYEALTASSLTDEQATMLGHYISTLRSADKAIEKLSYNDKVDEFYNKTLKTFPVSAFRVLISVDGPEYFGEN